MSHSVSDVPTTPFADQCPGTSGLRKKVPIFQQKNYSENFIHSIFACPALRERVAGSSIVIGSDGRYYSSDVIKTAIKIAAAHGVEHIYVAQHGLLSTPACSIFIRKHKLFGGLLVTASHNPGGPDADLGIKWNAEAGQPAPLTITESIFETSKSLCHYKIVQDLDVDLSTIAQTSFTIKDTSEGRENTCVVDVFDGVEGYISTMKTIFNFEEMKELITQFGFNLCLDPMHGVGAPYVKKIAELLGLGDKSIIHSTSDPSFGGLHPDPNLVWATDLVKIAIEEQKVDLGFALDGDADRNLILSRGHFVSPCDSVAVLALFSRHLPQFSGSNPLTGVARSMPTSAMLDDVAQHLGISSYTVPTGWKFFCNLMDEGKVQLCGEESFGCSSNLHREKDGCWKILSMLQICLAKSKETGQKVLPFELCREMWGVVGRRAFQRLDYEELETELANQVFSQLYSVCNSFPSSGLSIPAPHGTLRKAEDWTFIDEEGNAIPKQGIYFLFTDTSRVVFRKSGTGSTGATIRIYLERKVEDSDDVERPTAELVEKLKQFAVEISQIEKITGRSEPTVIT
ncbi:hypothetical protein P9112_007282 [Eukaryota sp. TZLM1-RC]